MVLLYGDCISRVNNAWYRVVSPSIQHYIFHLLTRLKNIATSLTGPNKSPVKQTGVHFIFT